MREVKTYRQKELDFTKRLFILLVTLLLVVLNETIGYSNLGIILAFIEALIVVFLVFIKNFTLAFAVHFLFVLTALEWPADLFFLPSIYTYRTVSILGVSISSLVLILLFIMSLIFFPLKIYIRRKIALWGISILSIGFLIGIWCMIFGDYKLNFFIDDLIYWIIVFMYVFLFIKALSLNYRNINLFEWIIISVLISRSIVKFSGVFLGLQKGIYGGVSIFTFDSIDYFIPTLVMTVQNQNCLSMELFIIVSWILGFWAVVLIESSGKGILLGFIIIFMLFLKFLKFKKINVFIKLPFVLLLVVGLFLTLSNIIPHLLESNALFSSKYYQATSILNLSWVKDPYVLPSSPQTRVLELYNIVACYLKDPIFFLTGRGFGGYFEDKAFYNYEANDRGGYSSEEVISRKFVHPHESLNVVLLKFGIMGLSYYFYILYKILKFKKLTSIQISFFLKFICFLTVLLFIGYSLKLAAILALSISIILLQ